MKRKFFTIGGFSLLISALLFCSLPVLPTEDADQNGRFGLEDVIISIRSLSEESGEASSFRLDFNRVVSSLSIAAGLKTVIKASEKRANPASFQWVYLIAFSGVLLCFTRLFEIFQKKILYISHHSPPEFPPPRWMQSIY